MFDVVLLDNHTGLHTLHDNIASWDEAIELCEEWVAQDPDLTAYIISDWGRICLYFEGV